MVFIELTHAHMKDPVLINVEMIESIGRIALGDNRSRVNMRSGASHDVIEKPRDILEKASLYVVNDREV